MSHANARLTPHGRALLIERVIGDGRPVSHVAKELGISRQCAHRWINRHRAQPDAPLTDRSSRPHTSPMRTSAHREAAVVVARLLDREGPLRIAAVTGVPARTVSRILARFQLPPLAWLDPITGDTIRGSRTTAVRYEREKPGELVHVDVKKLGRIPDGGGWRAHGRSEAVRGRGIGFDYVHAVIDDHSRLAYAEIHPDEKGATAAEVLARAATYFAQHGIDHIERVISDNAFAYRRSAAFKKAVADLGAVQKFIKPHCPWQNGKVERFNRTLAVEWAYRRKYTSNTLRADALAPWLEFYNTERIHTAIGASPISGLTPTF
jgi:transposase InsO family protein/transposase-like protein